MINDSAVYRRPRHETFIRDPYSICDPDPDLIQKSGYPEGPNPDPDPDTLIF